MMDREERSDREEWPTQSPDLLPLDYFLWDYLKSKVYKQDRETSLSGPSQDLGWLNNIILCECYLLTTLSKVYVTKPQTVQDLRRRILDEAALILRSYIRNVTSGFYD